MFFDPPALCAMCASSSGCASLLQAAVGVDQTAVPDLGRGPEVRRQNAQTPAGGVFQTDLRVREGSTSFPTNYGASPDMFCSFSGRLPLACFLPCWPASSPGLDDPGHLLENPQVTSLAPENITAIFRTTVNGTYIPLTVLSFAVEHHFFGFHPLSIIGTTSFCICWSQVSFLASAALWGLARWLPARVRFVRGAPDARRIGGVGDGAQRCPLRILLHAGSAVPVLPVFAAVRPPAARWLVHPGRAPGTPSGTLAREEEIEVLLLFSGCLRLFKHPRPSLWPLACRLCCACPIFFYGRKLSGRWLAEKLIHAAYIIPVARITASLHQRRLMDKWAEAALTAVWSFIFYIRKFIYPVDLSPLYATPSPVSLENPEILFSVILFAVYAACLARYRPKPLVFLRERIFYRVDIFFWCGSRLKGLHEVADRFMYLPSAGFCLLIGLRVNAVIPLKARTAGAGKQTSVRVALPLGLALVFMVLSIQSCRQTQVWENDTTQWAAVIQKGATDRLAYFAGADV